MEAGRCRTFFFALFAAMYVGVPLCAQHQVQFSQYMFNGVVLNPAYAGIEEVSTITAASRSQWSGAEGAPVTHTLSAQTRLASKRVGLGGLLVHDKIGVHKSLRISAVASYHLRLSNQSMLSFGMNGGLSSQRGDYASLGQSALIDPKVGQATYSDSHPELGAGVYLKASSLQMGLSTPQLLSERFQMSDTVLVHNARRYYGQLKYAFKLSSSLELEPGFLIKYVKGAPFSYDINATLNVMKVLLAGVSFRRGESIDFLLRAQVTKQLQLGYAYDHVVGDVAAIAGASHELMATFQFRRLRNNIVSPR